LGLAECKLIAYIGSFSAFEGLDDLLTPFPLARQQGLEPHLLLVGSLSQTGSSGQLCQSNDRLLGLARQLGVADRLVFTGPAAANSGQTRTTTSIATACISLTGSLPMNALRLDGFVDHREPGCFSPWHCGFAGTDGLKDPAQALSSVWLLMNPAV